MNVEGTNLKSIGQNFAKYEDLPLCVLEGILCTAMHLKRLILCTTSDG